jgi:hypothetical protein
MIFILEPQNLPFTLCLSIMLGIAILEGIMTILGLGLSSLLGNLVPDVDTDTDVGEFGLLNWLNVGRVPIMILLVIFLTVFGLTGYTVQAISVEILGNMLPAFLAAIIALFLSLPLVRKMGQGIGKILPTDETEVISENTFIGRVATISLGTAQKERPTRAKFKDNYGTTHLIMVEPEEENETFYQGDVILLVQRVGGKYLAIRTLLEK